jgi:hypothetical protein
MDALPRVISWFSCGAASAVATKLTLRKYDPDRVVIAYCETGNEHEDNKRFLGDCERWFNAPIIRLKSEEYDDCWDVWETRRYLAGINGAPCTTEMKVGPRLLFQRPTDIHVFGYTSDGPDQVRAQHLRSNYPELTLETPLIDAGIDKAATLALIQSAGISLPVMYLLGFWTNNCKTCVKATSANYWALVRKCFPEDFYRLAALARELGVRLARLKGERIFIDDIPLDHPTNDPISPACDFLCHLIEMDMGAVA